MLAKLLISSSLEKIRVEINKTLAKHLGITNISHPDVLYFREDQKLGIAEARKIIQHFSLKPYSAKGRAAVIEQAGSLTLEAQNALLKTLEELPREAIFILTASSDAQILPTITSRCGIINVNSEGHTSSEYDCEIEKLISSTLEERFAFIEKLKDKEEFFHALLLFFHKDLRLHPPSAEFISSSLSDLGVDDPSEPVLGLRTSKSAPLIFLKELLCSEEWLKQNVNIRAILEYLMLVMPNSTIDSNHQLC